jgi:signal transduction histidine kinase
MHADLQPLTEALGRKVQELRALVQVSARISSQLGLEPLLQMVVDAARELVGADMGGLLVLDSQDPGRYEFFKVSGWAGPTGFPEGKGLFALPYKTGQPLRVDDIRRHPASVGTPEGHPPVGALLAVPLAMRDRMLGSLFLANRPGGPTFSGEDEELLLAFSTQAAIAIENARLYAQAQELAVLRERGRISQRLHDSVLQIFFALGMEVDRCERLWGPGWPPGVGESLARMRALIHQGAGEIRVALFSLRDEEDTTRHPIQALRKLVENFQETSGIHTTLLTRGSLDMAPKAVWRCALKVVGESLHNVRRHSGSPVASVSVTFDGSLLHVSVQDAGKGISAQVLAELAGTAGPATHFGLRAMQRMVRELGGFLEVFRNDEGGTTVRAQLPCTPTP